MNLSHAAVTKVKALGDLLCHLLNKPIEQRKSTPPSCSKPKRDVKHKWQDLGNAIDVLLSFTLVAYMIGWGGIVHIPEPQITIWNISVVFNVFGAGYGRLSGSIKELKSA